ncbi:MAG: LuxR C-terminal-related transcriptional regulator, partial [Thermoanaerobaculia bacterium]
RYHHLFATLLQHHHGRTANAGEVAELHRRASAWYDAQRMPEPALEHALAAKDVDGAVQIVRTYATPRTLGGDPASALRWLDALPRERIEKNFELMLLQSVAYIADYQLVRAAETVERTEALLDENSTPHQRGAILGVRGSLGRMTGQGDLGTADLERARELVAPDTFWFSMVSFQLGMNAMLTADVRRLGPALAEARAHHSRPEQVIIAVIAQTFTGQAELARGHPEEAVALANESFAWIDITEKVTAGRPLDAFPNALLAEAHLAWNELEKARAFAERAAEHARRGFTIALFESARTLARVAEAQRDWETATRAAGDAARAIRNTGGSVLWYNAVDVLRYRIQLRRGDVQAAAQWIESAKILEVLAPWDFRRLAGLHCDTPLLLAARVRIEQERFDDARAILEDVLLHAISTGRLATQLEALVLLARAGGGVAILREALDLASRPRFVRVFVDEGPAILPLLERAAAGVSDRDFATRVLSAFDVPAKTVTDALSDREIEVLRIIASGASNQDAAKKLFIASGTVKKHLENIYAKLNVRGRMEAIARARDLGVI